jgi:hypothetical protein
MGLDMRTKSPCGLMLAKDLVHNNDNTGDARSGAG